MRSKGSAHELEQRRLLAVRRVNEGWTQRAVAEFLGVAERTVGAWVAAWRARGEAGLAAKPHPGPAPRLTPAQEAAVLAWLLKPAGESGFPAALWSARRVAKLIAGRFGVTYRPDYLREWLRKRGLTPQKPERKARERDQAAVDRWASEEWARLQKKRRRKARASS